MELKQCKCFINFAHDINSLQPVRDEDESDEESDGESKNDDEDDDAQETNDRSAKGRK